MLQPKERALLGALNHARTARGLQPLEVDPALGRAARGHSRTLLERDVLAHGAFAARLAGFGARGPAYGENLAWGVGALAKARSIVRAWLASPGHRVNLLRPGWRRIGIGAAVGTFDGYRGATVVTADFAGS
ncbi:MAG: CAP domain-containing protein [Actinobacteria bacterium]|nr:CAP domain-containing protein [Actinomycetota bacterium]